MILPALLREITSRNNGDCYCLNCLRSFRTKSKLKSLFTKYVKIKVFVTLSSSEDSKIQEFNQYGKFDKAPFIIYADLESLIKKIDGCKTNQEKLSTTKLSEHIPTGFSMSTISSFKDTHNKRDVYIQAKIARKSFINF